MITENTITSDATKIRGWIFYDADCGLCCESVRRTRALFARRGFVWEPLQTTKAAALLGAHAAGPLTEMKLLLADGRVLGGAEAWAEMFLSVWWLWPLGWLMRLPGLKLLSREVYRWLARNRHRLGAACGVCRGKACHRRAIPFIELP